METAVDGELVFRAPTGESIAASPSAAVVDAAGEALHQSAAERDTSIDPSTNLPWWDGAVPDYDWVVGSLLSA